MNEASPIPQVMKYGGVLVALFGLFYAGYEGVIEPLLPDHIFASDDLTQLVIGIFLILLGWGVARIASRFS